MLTNNVDISTIVKSTGLSVDEVQELIQVKEK
ncbi:hypothetical protein wTkk_000049 [Wolbachia endosymbiont of Trichogramma kaykai]